MVNSIKSLQAGGETPPLRILVFVGSGGIWNAPLRCWIFAGARATNGRPYVKARREKRPPPGGGSRVSGWGSTRDKGAFARQGSSSGCRTQSLAGGIQNKNELLSRALSPCRSRATPPPGGGLSPAGVLGFDSFQRGAYGMPPYGVGFLPNSGRPPVAPTDLQSKIPHKPAPIP